MSNVIWNRNNQMQLHLSNRNYSFVKFSVENSQYKYKDYYTSVKLFVSCNSNYSPNIRGHPEKLRNVRLQGYTTLMYKFNKWGILMYLFLCLYTDLIGLKGICQNRSLWLPSIDLQSTYVRASMQKSLSTLAPVQQLHESM